ncbi:unnamed protein product [Linum tenue]|uniref:Uncharacterized protein n=1 Tax=Linum tenue TaxID=586396 RepID=A0AAV0PTF0_9ROSI|nr:unnamed protein product [Linum tenue]
MEPKTIQSSSDESLPSSKSFPVGGSSLPKRQKVEEEEDDKESSDVSVAELMEAGKELTPKAETPFDPDEDEGYQRLLKKVTDSEGFDLDEDPPMEYIFAGFRLVRVHLNNPYHAGHARIVRSCIDFAIKKQSERVCDILYRFSSPSPIYLIPLSILGSSMYICMCNTSLCSQLTYVDTVSANVMVEVGHIYFITFRARDSSSQVKTYQAEVSSGLWDEMDVKIFREKKP